MPRKRKKSKLRRAREAAGMTRAELARRTRRHIATVATAERVGVQTVSNANKYARALDCEPWNVIEMALPTEVGQC